MLEQNDKKKKLTELEMEMNTVDFWSDKNHAQAVIKEIADLKAEIAGVGKYDSGDAILTIMAGAGGIDAEDFARMLLQMYLKYFDKKGWAYRTIHQNENDHGGFRNVTVEISGKGSYGALKKESGVHRLVRTSPFNAKGLRHTSFALVEFIPKFEKASASDFIIPEDELRLEFSRSSGPGGQNVNKKETAVRVVHIPTNLAVHADGERSQAQNKEKALQILRAKLYTKYEEDRRKKEQGLYVAKTMEIEWGNQIRSYVLHPYKMVKDHRTDFETAQVDKVLEGEIDELLDAERDL
ncbi:MAG: PCRF domain-containing protein [Candidatus Paceibacterota bacterium]